MEIQKMGKKIPDKYAAARVYYQIISAINELKLAKGEIQLVAYAAIKGNISDASIREEYCEKYGTTMATINNIVNRLKKEEYKHVILKKGKRIFVNPAITQLDFEQEICLEIFITQPKHEESKALSDGE